LAPGSRSGRLGRSPGEAGFSPVRISAAARGPGAVDTKCSPDRLRRQWRTPQSFGPVAPRWRWFALAVGTLALVARADAFVYWASASTNSIGRANLDGTGVNPSFITGANDPTGVAVDAAHVYWANTGAAPAFDTRIGRANIDGTGADQGFISTTSQPTGVAVDGAYVY
jgi:hypothetical protein